MPTFFARRYMRPPEAVGRTEKTVGVVVLLFVAAVVAAFVYQVATDRDYLFEVDDQAYAATPTAGMRPGPGAEPAAAQETQSLFPDPELEGWRAPRTVERFSADDLYVKIDGRADAYMKFGVVGLSFGRYYHEGDAERTVDVYWYDMGTPANALGMYRSEQAPNATPVSLGQAGYQVGGAVFFCQGSSYVQVMPSGLGDADARAALSIAEHLAKQIKQK
jgi:hypothetical protein